MAQQEKHTLVVGGSSGIGESFVKSLRHDLSHRISYISRTECLTFKDDSNIHFFRGDLADIGSLRGICLDISRAGGPIDDLLFSQRYRNPNVKWGADFDLMINATRTIIEACHSDVCASGKLSVVVLSSLLSRYVAGNQNLEYHVSRAALEQLVRYYAAKEGPRGSRVNAVSTCTILKPSNEQYLTPESPVVKRQEKLTPLGRIGVASDICSVIRFLMSDEAAFVTGQVITVDGGLTLKWHEIDEPRLYE